MITNLVTVLPRIGVHIAARVWGGYVVDNATPTRPPVLYYPSPFTISGSTLSHLFHLHSVGLSAPTGLRSGFLGAYLSPLYSLKDFYTGTLSLTTPSSSCGLAPDLFLHADNHQPAELSVIPHHIVPE